MLGLTDRYKKLTHPGLAAQLRPYIVEAGRSVPARRAAMRIAEACSLWELQGDLLAVALDRGTDPHIRSCAVSALGACGDEKIKLELLSLALDGQGPDPDNEIKGHALGILWPEHLKATDLFRHIARPRESYFGSYATFLTHRLPETLTRRDLPTALAWATAYLAEINHMGEFQRKKLADAILILAWDHIQDPEITPLVLRYVLAAIARHYELFVGIDHDGHDAFRQRVESDTAGRRSFLKAAAATPLHGHLAFSLMRSGLLSLADLPWLLSMAPSGEETAPGIDETALCDLVQAALNLNDEAHFNALCEAASHWPLLRSKYTALFDGVPLDSPLARQEKEHHRLMCERVERRRPSVDPPPAQRVRECLDRLEAGDIRAWWQMNRELTLTPESTHYSDLDYRITDMPGWVEADQATRERIVASAIPFLEGAKPTVDQWLGKDSVIFSALVLLRELQPNIYDRLDLALWRKWAPLVVAVPQGTGTETSKLHDAITADATKAAPAEIAAAVLKLIQAEKQKQAATEQPQPENIPSFLFLRQFDPSLENGNLRAGLLVELNDKANSPQQLAAILEFLLRAKVDAARDYALQLVAAWPCEPARRPNALSAAVTLLEYVGASAWPQLWPAIPTDGEFGRAAFLRLAHHHRFGAGLYADLPEAQLADLYVWL
jgi:hypothetical protein